MNEKFYTIGYIDNYIELLEKSKSQNQLPHKMGKRSDYPYRGALVFQSIEEAEYYLSKYQWIGFAIYELDTTLENTYVTENGYRCLIGDCIIVGEVKKGRQ
jgi:hypothetical protein